MSDYPEFTPTTDQVRSAYAHDPEAEYRDPVGFPSMQRENLRAFDRWLAAHDAEVRAGVLAEEPEWECTRQAEANGWTGPAVYRDEAHASDGLMHGWRVVRRRKAGPWVPVKREGAEADD